MSKELVKPLVCARGVLIVIYDQRDFEFAYEVMAGGVRW